MEVVEKVLEHAMRSHWLESCQDLSQKVLDELNNKNKGWNYIKAYMTKKHLSVPDYDREMELQKAKNVLFKKIKNRGFPFILLVFDKKSYNKKPLTLCTNCLLIKKNKLKQFLIYRGFEASVVSELFDI